ncbi:PREDICTED: uncharacterized protein LOC104820532 isoform X2 [Tarenaya hassleriana]|uniref:uncharacterized protein LOC104820532 isoform X2 n=1 Tax=Tarenaya hassleriana TaxID=28532 RepID=UPI00053C1A27|nr:PREDICTED: uncharacterized protein LOC104820532 isoform X2 [Tarenaya hassleriana]
MASFETPTVFFTHIGGFMARINDRDRSSEFSTGDLRSVSDPTANINGTNPSGNNNNHNISAEVVVRQDQDSRTIEQDGIAALGSSNNSTGNRKKRLTTDSEEEDRKDWLRLGIGPDTAKLRGCNDRDPTVERARSDQWPLELTLFYSSSSSAAVPAGETGIFHAPPSHPHHHELMKMMRYGYDVTSFYHYQKTFRPPPLMLHHNPPLLSSSPSSSLSPSFSPWMPMTGPRNFAMPFQPPLGVNPNSNNRASVHLGVGPSSDFRVVDPPRRPHSGIWFALQASQNQAREPFLPQLNKSYLRIKDEGITVRLLIKYLMKKLQLDSESEVEIRCRGQRLSPLTTIHHVRDVIWSPKDSSSSSPSPSSSPSYFTLPQGSTTDHVMILHYETIALWILKNVPHEWVIGLLPEIMHIH